jgi:MbtH protein
LIKLILEKITMAWDEVDDTATYQVVVNHEEQYSIWLEYKALPKGWRPIGKRGSKQECLDYIEEIWTDMRPLSLRQRMKARPPAEKATEAAKK